MVPDSAEISFNTSPVLYQDSTKPIYARSRTAQRYWALLFSYMFSFTRFYKLYLCLIPDILLIFMTNIVANFREFAEIFCTPLDWVFCPGKRWVKAERCPGKQWIKTERYPEQRWIKTERCLGQRRFKLPRFWICESVQNLYSNIPTKSMKPYCFIYKLGNS